jgi:murein L,D-transpeptidase YafK
MILQILLRRDGRRIQLSAPKGLIILTMAAMVTVAAMDGWSASPSSENKSIVADKILVEKAKRTMTLYRNGAVIKIFSITLGRNPVGAKVRQGDGRTPEGHYVIVGRKADSAYHRALRLSYPNAADRARASSLGIKSGGNIMIRGNKKVEDGRSPLRRQPDWTEGCIAVTNQEIEEIWKMAPNGTAVEIVP